MKTLIIFPVAMMMTLEHVYYKEPLNKKVRYRTRSIYLTKGQLRVNRYNFYIAMFKMLDEKARTIEVFRQIKSFFTSVLPYEHTSIDNIGLKVREFKTVEEFCFDGQPMDIRSNSFLDELEVIYATIYYDMYDEDWVKETNISQETIATFESAKPKLPLDINTAYAIAVLYGLQKIEEHSRARYINLIAKSKILQMDNFSVREKLEILLSLVTKDSDNIPVITQLIKSDPRQWKEYISSDDNSIVSYSNIIPLLDKSRRQRFDRFIWKFKNSNLNYWVCYANLLNSIPEAQIEYYSRSIVLDFIDGIPAKVISNGAKVISLFEKYNEYPETKVDIGYGAIQKAIAQDTVKDKKNAFLEDFITFFGEYYIGQEPQKVVDELISTLSAIYAVLPEEPKPLDAIKFFMSPKLFNCFLSYSYTSVNILRNIAAFENSADRISTLREYAKFIETQYLFYAFEFPYNINPDHMTFSSLGNSDCGLRKVKARSYQILSNHFNGPQMQRIMVASIESGIVSEDEETKAYISGVAEMFERNFNYVPNKKSEKYLANDFQEHFTKQQIQNIASLETDKQVRLMHNFAQARSVLPYDEERLVRDLKDIYKEFFEGDANKKFNKSPGAKVRTDV